MDYSLTRNQAFGYAVAAASRAISSAVGRAFEQAGYKVTYEQWALLSSLWNLDGQCQHELASCQGKDRPTITRLVDNLEKNNLVVRVPSREDKRIKRVYLTRKAKELKGPLTQLFDEVMDKTLISIDEESISKCIHTLKAAHEGLEENLK